MTTITQEGAAPINSGALENAARTAVYLSLPVIFVWFGAMKFTAYEAEAINGLIANSPFISFLLGIFSGQGISNIIGGIEVVIGLLISARFVAPRLAHY